jgi:predicted cupin superfamily sugar epimerase
MALLYRCGTSHFSVISDGRGEVLKLGDDLANGYSFQQMVPAGCWFASRPVQEDGFLLWLHRSSGFDFADFELAKKMNC